MRFGKYVAWLLLVPLTSCAAQGAGSETSTVSSGDAHEATGKADSANSSDASPEGCAVLRLANELDKDTLDESVAEGGVGLRSTAAEAIVKYRRGKDRKEGTADDRPIRSEQELEGISGVGPSSTDALRAYAQKNDEVRTPLRVATFNLRWFGRNGYSSNPLGSETRTASIRSVLTRDLADRDVIAFQEVSDFQLFLSEVIPSGWDCSTHGSPTSGTQRVVLCLRDRYVLEPEPFDSDTIYEPLGAGWLRPGIHGVIYDRDTDRQVAHIIAVHLKADAQASDRRLEQADILVDWFKSVRKHSGKLPIIALGDFNTHRAYLTNLDDDEWNLFDSIFAEKGVRLYDHPFENTYMGKATFYRLDHLFRSEEVCIAGARQDGPCNLSPSSAKVQSFSSRVSDHCPLSVDLDL
ncbi:MAG: endonuclease/exonuclease/phosphatase family protein [Myxococcales bacterium]|nr:endonuclease/exonuclease/phosphatase family protein [Myxococcales bacterium]